MELADLKYPNMRKELVEYLGCLEDKEYQINAWVNQIFPPGIVFDNLDLTIHFLFDDTPLAKNADSTIGIFLYDESEAVLVARVVKELGALFDKYGTQLSDAEYLSKPEWQTVVSSAKQAYAALVGNDK